MFSVILYVFLGPILLIEMFITIFKGLALSREAKEQEKKEREQRESEQRESETECSGDDEESEHIDYWGMDDD